MSIARPISLLLIAFLAVVTQLPYQASASTSPPITVVSDSAPGLNSIGLPGGEKLIQDSYNKTILVYVDTNSPARLGISFANSNPTAASSWSAPTKSVAPSSSYARPAAVLVNATRLRIIVEGGSGTGRISEVSVTLNRDAQNNIASVSFSGPINLDISGSAHYPTAALAQNGDILAAWNFHDATSSRVKTFRWRHDINAWKGFGGSSNVPDDAVVDTSNLKDVFPSIIERQDNHNVYVMGNEGSGGNQNLVYNKATFDGTNWSWGTANLAYESLSTGAPAARGSEDATSLTWDPVHSLVVVAYDVSGTNHYGVFTLSSSDVKTHRDTPDLILTDNDWGNIVTDETSGDYYIILVDANDPTGGGDGGTGRVAYTKSASGTGPWNTTLTNIDSTTTNRGLVVRRTGSGSSIDLVYANDGTSPSTIRFVRIITTPSPLTADFTFTPPSPAPGQSVTFTGTASGGTPPYTYSWNFGDSGTGSGATVTHIFSQGGGYTVTLTVTDSSTKTATAQHLVAVGSFSFAAAGDWGYGSNAQNNWNSLSTSGASFVIALGDLLYNTAQPPTEQNWCNTFKSNTNNVEIIVGNHDTWESNSSLGGGSINKFIQYCPFTLGTYRGSYGFQYSFDYPASSPLARFILVEPDEWNGTTSSSAVDYSNGTVAQAWVGGQIDGAKSAGIPWVIVGMHKDCVTSGAQGCEITQDLMRFLINKKVDLVLQGHDHNYQRSKQLTCATQAKYVSSCVSNNGATGSYTKGAGTIFLIDGTGGDSHYGISATDPENSYFAALNDTSFGYTKYTISSSSIQAQFIHTTGSFTDNWSISGGSPDYSISANPTSLTVQAGSSGTSAISLSSLNSFSGSVTLSAAVSPAGPTTSFSVNPVSLSSGGTAGSTLTISTTASTAAGNYNVTVTGTSSSLSHKVSVIVTVTVLPLTASFTVSASPTVGSPVTFTATASGGTPPYSYSWTFGDAGTGTGNPTSHTYSRKGTYNVTLTVTDAAARTAKSSTLVTVAPTSLTASIGFTPSTPTVGQSVTFTGTVQGGSTPYTFNWSFGDGTTGTVNPVSHSYSTKGTYAVKLNVTDANAVKTTATTLISIAPIALSASFSTSSSPTAGTPVTFTATTSGGTTPYTFAWNFGDATIAATNPASHTYAVKGSYTVKLNVTDSNNVRITISNIVAVGSPALTADFSISPASPSSGKTTTFAGTASGGTGPYTFSWNFGDSTPKTSGATVSHAYARKGSYTVTLNVTDANSVLRQVLKTVIVAAQPVVVTATCPTSGVTAGQPFNCTVSATGGTAPYAGTGTISRTEPTKGPKTETFTVTDSNGISATGSATVNVGAQPLVITVTCPSSGVSAGKPFNCTVSATGGSTPYTGTGTFSRTEATKGTKTETFSVTDTNAINASGSASVNVAAQALTVTVSCPASGVTAGKTFNCTVSATGGTAPYSGTGTISRTEPTKGIKTETFIVTDVNTVSASGSASVNVAAQPLAITATCPKAQPGQPVTCTASAAGGTTAYTFSWSAAGGTPSSGTGSSFTTTYSIKGQKTIVVTVTDANSATANTNVNVIVNTTPVVVAVTCPTSGVTAGKPFNCNVSATGGTAPYSGTGTISRTEDAKGIKTETFAVTDANAASASGSASVNVGAQPLIVTVTCPTSGVTVGKPFNCTVSATGGTAPYTGTGTIGRTEPTKGTRTETFTVTDANAVSASGSVSVIVSAQPLAVSTVTCPANIAAGKPFTCTATATGGTQPYTFSGLTQTAPSKGPFSFTVTVTDANIVSANTQKSVTVAAQPLAVASVICPANITAGKSFTCTATATGGTQPYVFSGLEQTAARKGPFTFTVTASDANSASANTQKTVDVSAQPLVVTATCPNSGVTAGKPFDCIVSSTGGTTPYTGTGTISRTESTKGTKTETFAVTDANNVSASGSALVDVGVQPLVVTVACPASAVTAGEPFNCTISATGGTGPYAGTDTLSRTESTKGAKTETFTVTDSNGAIGSGSATVTVVAQPLAVTVGCPTSGVTAGKPFNCTISATGGTLPYIGTGTFSVTEASKGSKTETFTVTDANAGRAFGSASVNVAAQPLTADFTLGSASATAGEPVTFTANVLGGTSPYAFSWTFGDGRTGTGSPISHTYPLKGTFNVTFTASDLNGATSELRRLVTVTPQPLTPASCPSTGTAGQPITCTGTASGGTGPYTFSWDVNGDGTVEGVGMIFTTTFPVKGTYSIRETVTDANGDIARVDNVIRINSPLLTADFTFGPASPGIGEAVTFNAQASGGTGGYSFSWNFGDGPTKGSGAKVSHTYSSKGSYTVALNATDANNVLGQVSKTVVVVGEPLTADFSPTPPSPNAGKSVSFTATISGGTSPYTFSWNFGDSGLTVSGNPTSHTYSMKGSFTIMLNVTDANSLSASVTKTIVVSPQPLTLTVIVATAVAGKPASFDARASGGTSPYTFVWDFGDQSSGTGASPTHTYVTTGNYTVQTIVTDANGATSTTTMSVNVARQPVHVSLQCSQATTGKPLTCDALASGGTSPYTYAWTVDGTSITSTAGSRLDTTFSVKGTHAISVRAMDSEGGSAADSVEVSVSGQPLVAASDCGNGVVGELITCTATGSGGTSPYVFNWRFSDGVTASGSSVSRSFSVKGSYTAIVVAADSNLVSSNSTTLVTIRGAPLVSDFMLSPDSQTAGELVMFTAAVAGGTSPFSLSWTFGDGTTGTGNGASHVYAVKGSYNVTLTVIDANAVTSTVSKTILVRPQPLAANFQFSPITPVAGVSLNFSASVSGGTGPYLFVWNFGDGSIGTGNTISHIFALAGSYSVTLTVTDSNSSTIIVGRMVVVAQPPSAGSGSSPRFR